MTDYTTIAGEYKESKKLVFRKHVEEHTIFALAGDLRGKTALDLACGDGIYSRALRRAGAERVVGVDNAESMLALCRAEEARAPLGITYQAGDALALGAIDAFDIVVCSYLLNYARTREDLLAFCRTIYENLKEGGRLVGFNNNPAQAPESFASSRKYGFIKSAALPIEDGSVVRFTNFLEGRELSIDNYHLSPEAHAWAFREAGFRGFAFRPPQVSEEGTRLLGAAFWREFLEHQPMIGLEAMR